MAKPHDNSAMAARRRSAKPYQTFMEPAGVPQLDRLTRSHTEEDFMATKIMAGAVALALAASSVLAASSANAQGWHGHGGHWHGGGGAIAGFAAGALIGGAIAGQPYGYYGPGYAYGPAYAYEPGYEGGDGVGYCLSRFKSYDPQSGTYLGYDGQRHPCP
jgi:BA14K-like protein